MNILNRGDSCDGVAKIDLTERIDRFATLATRLDNLDVARISLERHACHACHVNQETDSVSSVDSLAFSGKKFCFQWLKIAMEEGHLEPSQSCVGKTVGWPERWMFIKSLWIDFYCWFRKQQIAIEEMPDEYRFYELLDFIFLRHDDKYEFPTLEQCRQTFVLLRQEYERD